MDWGKIDWAVVAATFIGPIVAVSITLWHQSRTEQKQSRRELYSVMMRWRRHITSTEFVGALNLVPVHFAGRPNVLNRYADLMAGYEDNGWSSKDTATLQRLNDQVQTRVALLLSSMSDTVGVKIEQLEILRGAYAPQGWADEEAFNRMLKETAMQMLSGKRPLTVTVVQQPHPAATHEQ